MFEPSTLLVVLSLLSIITAQSSLNNETFAFDEGICRVYTVVQSQVVRSRCWESGTVTSGISERGETCEVMSFVVSSTVGVGDGWSSAGADGAGYGEGGSWGATGVDGTT